MRHLLNRWFLLLVLLLGMSALACNLPFGGEEEPTPRPAQEEDAEDEEAEVEETAAEDEAEIAEEPVVAEETAVTDESAEESEEEGGLLSGLFPQSLSVRDTVQEFDTLDSYEMQMEITTEISETTQLIQASIIVSTDPPQSYMTFSFEGVEDMAGMDTMSMTNIEGVNYMIVPQFGCVSTTEGEGADTTFSDTLDANQFLEEVGEATLVGEETVNGIETLHYTFDETAVDEEMTQFNWAQGDVYIAKEGNYVVRFHMEGEGASTELGLALEEDDEETAVPEIGLITIEMNLTSVNEPVEISIPEECANSGVANSEYPILEDAYETSSFGGIMTYKTETLFADAVAFYQESLTAEGWTYQEDESFILEGSTALMYFNQGDQTLTVTVTEETGTATFTVVIFAE